MNIELHITYRCSLSCPYCNRGCSLNTSHTPDMTFEQFTEFFENGLGDRVVDTVFFVGGEPTLHPDFERMVLWLRECKPEMRVRVYSNQFTQESKEIIARLARLGVEILQSTAKTSGSIVHDSPNLFLSPDDLFYVDSQVGCEWEAGGTEGCGYSVDSMGITACSIGGAIDGILGLNERTWDWSYVNRGQLRGLCKHCGKSRKWSDEPKKGVLEWRGQRVSKTWFYALDSLKGKKKE